MLMVGVARVGNDPVARYTPDGKPVMDISLAFAVNVTFRVYTQRGLLIFHKNFAALPAGNHTLTWNGVTDSGTMVASGIYLLQLEAGQKIYKQKVVIIR